MGTFLWHDYETWGVDPQVDRPAQFAAIRTDMALNEIEEPIMLYAKPPRDCLIQPDAVMVTGITPQYAERHGVNECDFIAVIHNAMAKPGTCSVGYNSIRFDDEVTRNTLYRNFYDPYAREYQNGNSRWDLIDVVRLCYALRPEGFVWPRNEEKLPNFRLEKLTAANGIEQEGAHDALVDVRATIALAKKIRKLQPKLFTFALSLRNKHAVAKQLKIGSLTPVFHVSSMFGAANHCCSIVLPLAMHPTNKNEVIAIDLRHDPSELLQMDHDERVLRQFSNKETLMKIAQARGVTAIARLPIKNIHLNKSPMIAPVSMLSEDDYERLQLDASTARKNMEDIKKHPLLIGQLIRLFSEQKQSEPVTDADRMIYSGGFFTDQDKQHFHHIRSSEPEALMHQYFSFSKKHQSRLNEMLFRYRGRNFPSALNEEEKIKWKAYCEKRLVNPELGASILLNDYQMKLSELSGKSGISSSLLESLKDWPEVLSGLRNES